MSTKYPSPLLGYNNNVRHKGKVFHIQTEDSGPRYGHIITHLFMDGGRILKSVKTSYAEYLGNDRMADIVREMMKQQHKAMFIALRDGKFDALASGSADVSQATRAIVAGTTNGTAPARSATPPPKAASPASPGQDDASRVDASQTEAPPTIRQPQPDLALDVGALERAAAASGAAQALRAMSNLPPPPANLFREKGATGKYRMTPVPPAAQVPPAAGRGASKSPAAESAAAAERRYAPTRPASIFGQARPQHGKTIFGEDLISDKSLDEVILSYLSEDLEEKK